MLRKIVCFGDSITFGEGVGINNKWVTLLEKYCRQNISPNVQVINSGVSGNTAYMGLNRVVKDLQEHEPDWVTIQFGMNDCNYWQTDRGIPRTQPDTFKACLKELVLRSQHFGAQRILMSTNHPSLRQMTMLNGKSYEQNNIFYNSLIRQVAQETHCALYDAHQYFGDQKTELSKLLLPEPDLLHLSVRGNQLYFEGICQQLFSREYIEQKETKQA